MRTIIFVTAIAVLVLADHLRADGYYRREVLSAIDRTVPGSGRFFAALY